MSKRQRAKNTGSVYESMPGTWRAMIAVETGKRRSFALPGCSSRKDAEKRAAVLADIAARLRGAGLERFVVGACKDAGKATGAEIQAIRDEVDRLVKHPPPPPKPKGLTFRELAEKWTSGELHRLYPDHVKLKRHADDDAYRFHKHIFPVVQNVALADFTLEHAEDVMRRLPSNLSSSSRRNVALLVHRVLKLAVYPLRAIEHSPLPPGFLPRIQYTKALTYLHPSEDSVLLACKEVPLALRVFYGFLGREGMRLGEALSLRWQDFDLERGAVVLDRNKTNDPRSWALDPGVVRALRVWRAKRGNPDDTKPAFVDGDGKPLSTTFKYAIQFRAHLELAGVKRAALFEDSDVRRPIRLHDLRASFVTLSLGNGRTEAWVQDRTGHRSSFMLNRYRRAARMVSELRLGTLAPLDQAIPELAGAATEPPTEQSKKPSKAGKGRASKTAAHAREVSENSLRSPHRIRTGTPKREAGFKFDPPDADSPNLSESHDAIVSVEDVSGLNRPLLDAECTVLGEPDSPDPAGEGLDADLHLELAATHMELASELLNAGKLDQARTHLDLAREHHQAASGQSWKGSA